MKILNKLLDFLKSVWYNVYICDYAYMAICDIMPMANSNIIRTVLCDALYERPKFKGGPKNGKDPGFCK